MIIKGSILYTILLSLLTTPAFAGENRLIPGKSIGQISLGETLELVHKKLGEPDSGDGALGHFWDTWQSRSASKRSHQDNLLEIYSVRTPIGGKVLVEQIRVTSSWFATTNGISTRSSLVQIQRRFPHARAIAFYDAKDLHSRVTVYDDIAQGIAFEMSGNGTRCLAITIHRKEHNVTQIYSARHDYQPIK